jgi:integrase/recombinase XerD
MSATQVQTLAKIGQHFAGILDLAGRVNARTLTEYRRDLHLYLTFCQGEHREPSVPQSLRAWRGAMAEHTRLSPHTINRRLAAVKRVIRATALLGDLPMDVAHGFSLVEPVQVGLLRSRLRTHRPSPLLPEHVRQLIDAPDTQTLSGLRDRALLSTFAGSGCRISEIVGLHVDDILAAQDTWLIRVLGKGQHTPRLAPLNQLGRQAIDAWLHARSAHIDVQAVFTAFSASSHGRPLARAISSKTAWRVVRRYAAQVGLPHVTPHDFRRFVGTQIAKKDLRAAQLALGHKRLETTAKHYILDELQAGLTDGLY